ncbi:MAG TPA: phosphatase PAP2 family protein [Pseudolabrys sp.]|nr:phosphatase PAP2 family protein [Pseudolabrys sp.]
MNRTGLIIALVIAALNGLAFGLFPELELSVARHFHDVVDAGNNTFAWRIYPPLMLARDIGLWVSTAIIIPVVAVFVFKLIMPTRKLLIPGRAIIFLTATLALGPGLLVNVVLKDHWGRSRPIDVTQLGGTERYVRWWDPRGECPNNCSFVSGDVAGAFWTIAPAALAPPQWRALAYGAALALGTGMAALRVMAGAHFLSDAIFAGVFTFLIIWLAHGLIYRWPRTRLSDAHIERAIERIAMPGYLALCSLFCKKKSGGGKNE